MSNWNSPYQPHGSSPNTYSNPLPPGYQGYQGQNMSPFALPHVVRDNQGNNEFEVEKTNFAVSMNPLPRQNPPRPQVSVSSNIYDHSNFREILIGKDDEEYPNTVSRFWIKIENMKKMYPFNTTFTSNVNKLKAERHIAAWKRSRGDGNCYFRAVITSFYDIIHKPYAPVEDLERFKEILSRLYLDYPGIEEFIYARDEILKSLDESIYLKQNKSKIDAYENALKNMQNEKFDINLVKVSRFITACTLMEVKDSDEFFPYLIDGYEGFLHEIMEMGKEGGELTLILLPTKLKIQVIQYMYLDKEIVVQKFPDQVEKNSKIISIVRRAGHYDILYLKQSLEIDGCNLDKGAFSFTENFYFYEAFKA